MHPTILSSYHPLLLPPSVFPSIRVSSNESTLRISGQSIGVSALASVLPVNIQDWFPLQWTSLFPLQSKGLSRVFPTPQFKSIDSLVLSFLYSPTLTSIHDCWENHSFDNMDLHHKWCSTNKYTQMSIFFVTLLRRKRTTSPNQNTIFWEFEVYNAIKI